MLHCSSLVVVHQPTVPNMLARVNAVINLRTISHLHLYARVTLCDILDTPHNSRHLEVCEMRLRLGVKGWPIRQMARAAQRRRQTSERADIV
jgi:hypothetical protein